MAELRAARYVMKQFDPLCRKMQPFQLVVIAASRRASKLGG
ncbi:hypothetical protein CHELA41_40257 [Hyphomicrobiales bacterium]|nr:hypothetical protein CHELA41_40257 [Hyphomicrobiales bacterium]